MNMQPDHLHPFTVQTPPLSLCNLPQKDYWSTPFAETLLTKLDLFTGASILDVACGSGLPTFFLAHKTGPTGKVLGLDMNIAQLARARAFQGPHFPWLEFRHGDVREISSDFGQFDRITGNLSFMFFRPNRKAALQQLSYFLNPGGQLVLTFPSLGTFESLWERVDQGMREQGLEKERSALTEYRDERPSAKDAEQWLKEIGLEHVDVEEFPLQINTGPGQEFLYHPLLRGGFLDDIYECFTDQHHAETFMNTIANDIQSFIPLMARRCVMSGWRPITKETDNS